MRRRISLWQVWNLATAGGVLFAFVYFSLLGAGYLMAKDASADTNATLRNALGVFGSLILAYGVWLSLHERHIERRFDVLTRKLDVLSFALQKEKLRVIANRDEMPPWSLALQGRNVLVMAGMSLRSFVRDHSTAVRKFAESGGKVEFILIDPDSNAVIQAAATYSSHTSVDEYVNEIRASIARIRSIQRDFPRQIYLKVLPHIPIASITLLDGGESPAKIITELYTLDESSQTRPHIIVDKEVASDWFQYFLEELNRIRKNSRQI